MSRSKEGDNDMAVNGSSAERRLRIRLFGPITVEEGDRSLGPRNFGGLRPKQVLEILLAARGRLVPKDRLAELLWGDDLPQNRAGALETNISVLRRRLGPDGRRGHELILTATEAYRFATELADIDLDRFDELLERARRARPHEQRRLFEAALALACGEVLEDEPYAEWAKDLRGTYGSRVLGARLDAADAALGECDYVAGLAHAEAAIGLDRFGERARRTAMLALYALGRQHEALAAYHDFRRLLDEELGLEPTRDTRELETAILRQVDVSSLLPRPVGETAVVRGERSLVFLGRSRELASLDREVRQAIAGSFALLVVEGEAGLGKTRLLEELVSSLDDVRIGKVACSEIEQHLPYVPLAAALRDALDGIELDPDCLPALTKILPELRLAGQYDEFPELDVLEALVELIRRHAPLVLLLDDLHWADVSTIAALGYLRRRCAEVPVAVVATARPEELTPEHPLHRLEPTALIRLEALTPGEVAALGIADLYERTGGHPRFVAASLASRTEPDFSLDLGETLLARCRAEGPKAYRILQSAAALEQPFEPEVLAAVLGVEPVGLTEELEWLSHRRFLEVDGLRFRFRFEAVQRVLSASLSPARRRLLLERAQASVAVGGTPSPEQ